MLIFDICICCLGNKGYCNDLIFVQMFVCLIMILKLKCKILKCSFFQI